MLKTALASIIPILLLSSVIIQAYAAETKLDSISTTVKNVKTKVDAMMTKPDQKSQLSVIMAVKEAKQELNKIKSDFVKMPYAKNERKQFQQYGKVIKNAEEALNSAFWAAKFANYDEKNFMDNLNKFKMHYSKVIEMSKKTKALL
jgi:outer membrane murein-binding lipoprotein Lpp